MEIQIEILPESVTLLDFIEEMLDLPALSSFWCTQVCPLYWKFDI